MNTFAAYTVGLDLARELEPVIEIIKLRNSEVADQIDRARQSVLLDVAEGARRSGGDKRRFYSYASGSASEILGALDLASVLRYPVDDLHTRTPRSRTRLALGPHARSKVEGRAGTRQSLTSRADGVVRTADRSAKTSLRPYARRKRRSEARGAEPKRFRGNVAAAARAPGVAQGSRGRAKRFR